MARYFFNIRDAVGLVADEEGSDCASARAALDEAEASARDIARQFVHDERALAGVFVDIEDDRHAPIASIAVTQIVQFPKNVGWQGGDDPALAAVEREYQAHKRLLAREREDLDKREASEDVRWREILRHWGGRKF